MKNSTIAFVVVSCLAFVGLAPSQQHRYAPVTMGNHVDFPIDFRVDDEMCPTGLTRPGLDCDFQVTVGENHTFTARRGQNGEIVKQNSGVPNGDPIVWTVCYQDQHAGSCGN